MVSWVLRLLCLVQLQPSTGGEDPEADSLVLFGLLFNRGHILDFLFFFFSKLTNL